MKGSSLFVSGVVSGTVFSLVLLSNPLWGQADAQRGAAVLKRERCVECHSIGGQGAGTAPDLGKRQAQAYTPARLASVMWNHAPQMWPAFEAKKISIPKLSEQDSEDVFAYLYSLMYFDQPGDTARGAAAFQDKGCVLCHSLENPGTKGPKPTPNRPKPGPGLPVAAWSSVADPVLLVQQMWNHAASMKDAQASLHLGWLKVSGQDLVDISAYLDSLPVIHVGPSRFSLPQPASGAPLFAARCAICHQGTLSLEMRLSNLTLTDVAAEMWNHAPRMMNAPILNPSEMRRIVAYVWERQYMGPAGNVAKGRAAFVERRCGACHEGPNAVGIGRAEHVLTPLQMISAVWVHGPEMMKKVQAEGGTWPTLSPEEVADLVAYLNTRP